MENKPIGLNEYFKRNNATVEQECFGMAAFFRGELLNEFCLIEYFIEDTISSYYYTKDNEEKHEKLFYILTKKIKQLDTKINIYLDTVSNEYPNAQELIDRLNKKGSNSELKNTSLSDIRNAIAHWNVAGGQEHWNNYTNNGKVSFIQKQQTKNNNKVDFNFKGLSFTMNDINLIKKELIEIKNGLELISNQVRTKVGLTK